MKKTFLYLALASIALNSCRKEEDGQREPEVSIETQNTYDDQAATKYLENHYFDAKGNVRELKATDDTQVKLSALNPITLPSGVIYVMKPGAQPNPGKTIGNSDIINLMSVTIAYTATKNESIVAFTSPFVFQNTVDGAGVPEVDPPYFYVQKAVLDKNTDPVTKQKSFYEIEGFKEALLKFKAYDLPNESDYNLQGIIIVPSRAAFARDPHFNYSNISFRNRSFIFNFQVYKSTTAPDPR